jgi:hypothetical protein
MFVLTMLLGELELVFVAICTEKKSRPQHHKFGRSGKAYMRASRGAQPGDGF